MKLSETQIQILNKLIEKAKLQEALKQLKELYAGNKGLENECLQIHTRLIFLENQNRQGLIDQNDYRLEYNRITKSILDLIKDPEQFEKAYSKWDNFHSIVLGVAVITIIVILGYFLIYILPFLLNDIDQWRHKKRIDRIKFKEKKERVEKFHQFIDSIEAIPKHLRNPNRFDKNHFANRPSFQMWTFEGYDTKGRKAEYIIYLSEDHNWKIGNEMVSEKNDSLSDICIHLKSDGISNQIRNDDLKSIICFGNTSNEELCIPYALENEEDRSLKRAKKLQDCVRKSLSGKLTPVFTLNLGKHMIYDKETKWQRQILVVGLIKKDDNVIEEEALFHGLVNQYYIGKLRFNIMDYSKVINRRLILN